MRKPCCDKEGNNKGAWSKQEDHKLVEYIRAHGEGSWRSLPKAAGLHRCGKSCRLRWINYLRPDIKRGNFDQDEEDLIIKLHALLGNRWSLIAGRLPGRTDNEVKNYWNSHIKKKLLRLGIDPNNHKLSLTTRPRAQISNCSDRVGASLGRRSMDANTQNNNVSQSSSDNDKLRVTTSGHERPSDNASCLEDIETSHHSQERKNLNLDLTISVHSPGRETYLNENRADAFETAAANCRPEIDCGSSPTTLLLFS
ncbi:hypothetical protein SAY87_024592 [Trapa incisa]|uniref:Uncharacterized protein n=1 Tax=Trapa incisa TaxID=236973 RepID=A0AAN7GG62_9MYRT|nr:hypothetical protein SAY87_024592 [Trapa incisa]